MSTHTGWKQSVAATLHDELEWYEREASASPDAMEAAKYRGECAKITLVLLTLLRVQTMSRPLSLLERAALRGAGRPMSKETHRALMQCREGMTKDQIIHNPNPQS